MAHNIHNIKYKPPMNKIPQYKVLQPYGKDGKPLQHYFITSTTEFDYKSNIGMIYASKYRSISYLSTIHAPLKNPSRVFSKTPSTRCRSEI